MKKSSQQRGASRSKVTQRKTFQTRRPRRQQTKRRSKPRGFHFESASESEDSDESVNKSSRILQGNHAEDDLLSPVDVEEVDAHHKGDARTNSPPVSDVEDMDTNDSNESDGGGERLKDDNEFTNLRGQGHDRKGSPSLKDTQGGSVMEGKVSDNKAVAKEQNLSFLDDIFLSEPSTKEVRKPPPKKSLHNLTSGKNSTHKDLVDDLWDDSSKDHVKDTMSDAKKLAKPPPKRRYPRRSAVKQSLQKHPIDDLWGGDLEKDSTEADASGPGSSDVKNVRKPPFKRKSPYRSLPKNLRKDHILEDVLEDDLTDSVPDSAEFTTSGTEMGTSGTDPECRLWRKNSKYGLKLEEIDASLEEESQSIFNKYSSSFVANKNFKRKLYQFDAEKGDIFSESLSSA